MFCNGGFLISVLSSPPPVPSEPPPPAEDIHALITIHPDSSFNPVNPGSEREKLPPPLIPPQGENFCNLLVSQLITR